MSAHLWDASPSPSRGRKRCRLGASFLRPERQRSHHKTMGAISAVQVVDRVGEHAHVTIPTRNLLSLLGELFRIGLNDALSHTL